MKILPIAIAILLSSQSVFSAAGDAYETARAKIGIKAIAIRRTGCFGTCPIYSAELYSNGVVNYSGRKFVKRRGEFSAKIYLEAFDQLARLANEIRFKKLQPVYPLPPTFIDDAETVITTITYSDGTTKTVSDTYASGPATLWALNEMIDQVLSQATDWKKVKKSPHQAAAASQSPAALRAACFDSYARLETEINR